MTPVTEKPLKPSWFHDGSWWMLAADAGDWRVYKRTDVDTWESASSVLTSSITSVDVHLHGSRVTWYGWHEMGRISYNGGSWVVDVAATSVPNIGGGGDSAAGGHLVVDGQGRTWGFGDGSGEVRYFVRDTDLSALQGDTLLTADPPTTEHLSRSVVWDGKVGVLWDNQTVERMRFIWRNDTDALSTWQTIEDASANTADNADDHGDIVPGPDGDLLAIWKTGLSGDADPIIRYARRTSAGSWVDETTVFSRFGSSPDNEYTRPRIAYDEANDRLIVVAIETFVPGLIRYRVSPRLSPSFGDVQTAIASSTGDPTVPHHAVDDTSDLLVLAVDGGTLSEGVVAIDPSIDFALELETVAEYDAVDFQLVSVVDVDDPANLSVVIDGTTAQLSWDASPLVPA